jgi:hypothetical protein
MTDDRDAPFPAPLPPGDCTALVATEGRRACDVPAVRLGPRERAVGRSCDDALEPRARITADISVTIGASEGAATSSPADAVCPKERFVLRAATPRGDAADGLPLLFPGLTPAPLGAKAAAVLGERLTMAEVFLCREKSTTVAKRWEKGAPSQKSTQGGGGRRPATPDLTPTERMRRDEYTSPSK